MPHVVLQVYIREVTYVNGHLEGNPHASRSRTVQKPPAQPGCRPPVGTHRPVPGPSPRPRRLRQSPQGQAFSPRRRPSGSSCLKSCARTIPAGKRSEGSWPGAVRWDRRRRRQTPPPIARRGRDSSCRTSKGWAARSLTPCKAAWMIKTSGMGAGSRSWTAPPSPCPTPPKTSLPIPSPTRRSPDAASP